MPEPDPPIVELEGANRGHEQCRCGHQRHHHAKHLEVCLASSCECEGFVEVNTGPSWKDAP